MTALLANLEANSSGARRVISPNRSRLDSILRRAKMALPPSPSSSSASPSSASPSSASPSPSSSLPTPTTLLSSSISSHLDNHFHNIHDAHVHAQAHLAHHEHDDDDVSPTPSPTPTPPLSPSASSKASVSSSSSSSSLSSPSSPTRRPRAPTAIRFSEDDDRIHIIPNRDQYTASDFQTLFFQSFEYQQIKANNRILVRMMDDPCTNGANGQNFEDDIKYCFRGLEHRSAKEAPSRKYTKAMATRAVFLEQFRQCREGILHSEGSADLIRTAYRAVSTDSQQNARRWGAIDEKYARKLLHPNDPKEEEVDTKRVIVADRWDDPDAGQENAEPNNSQLPSTSTAGCVDGAKATCENNCAVNNCDGSDGSDEPNQKEVEQRSEADRNFSHSEQPIAESQPLLELEKVESMATSQEAYTFPERQQAVAVGWPVELSPFGLMEEILITRNSPRVSQTIA